MFYTNPEIIGNAGNIWIAFGIGVSSGVSATGTNQIIKQLFSNEKKARKSVKCKSAERGGL